LVAHRTNLENIMAELTRRMVLTVAAATAVTAIGSTELPLNAAADEAADLELFVKLSAALTGIDANKLAPQVDPIQVHREYFQQAKLDPAFEALLLAVRADPANPRAAAEKLMTNPNIKYLGRSIILMWYLGAWYDPRKLAQFDSPKPPPFPVTADRIVSPKAYSQGWTWRVAQAHPMGYSELRFGYWSDEPPALDDFIRV
jgi:hypothetical protein